MTGSLYRKRWQVPPEPPPAWAATIVAALGIPAPLARLLYARGLHTPAAAAAFLDPPPPPDPAGLPGMAAAVLALSAAAARGEGVLVYGDYDCDGVCSTALATTALESLGLRVAVHLPARGEGYGMRPETLPGIAAAAGCHLVLAVDNGSTAHEAIAAAGAAGVAVIVTDHHQLGPDLPAAVAVVNPLRDPAGPFAGLAGVGVAWCLAQALGASLGRSVPEATDLVAIGTIADVVPLRGVNRALVRQGLATMAAAGVRPGVRALLQACRVARGAAPGTRDISHGVAPRLNAPGRLGTPQAAYDLLMARDGAEATAALAVVEECNRRRQELSAALLATAEEAAATLPAESRAVVLADARWHPGLVGPAASKLMERLRVPVLLAGIDERGVCRGSGRGPAGWDLTGALRGCADLLVRFGGHAQAAGFEVEVDRLADLRAALHALAPDGGTAGGLLPWGLDGVLRADAGEWTAEVALALQRMGPFGEGNPEPALLVRGVAVQRVRPLGRESQHARMELRAAAGRREEARGAPVGANPPAEGQREGGAELAGTGAGNPERGGAVGARSDAGVLAPGSSHGEVEAPVAAGVAFGCGPWAEGLAAGGPFDLVVRPEVDRYRGRAQLQLTVLDLAPSSGDWGPFLAGVRQGLPRRHPDRDALAAAFRLLRHLARQGAGVLPPEPTVVRHLAPACLPDEAAARAALLIFREVGLLDAEGQLVTPEDGGKVDLGGSARFRAAQAAWAAVAQLEGGV